MLSPPRNPSVLALILVALAFSLAFPAPAPGREYSLLLKTPRAPQAKIEMNGPGWFSAPISDERAGHILYRCITGTRSRELVESLYYLKINQRPDGGLTRRTTVPAQAFFGVNPAHGARKAHGAVSDGQGGMYYLWSSSVVRIGADGRKLWPSLRGRPDKEGRLWKYPGTLYTINTRERVRSATLDNDGKDHALVFWESDSGFRAQKIAPWGERQWGDQGILLGTRRRGGGRGVGDGRGGAIALVARLDFPRSVRVKFIDSKGKVTREVGAALNLEGEPLIARSDGAGGMLLLYIEPVVRGGQRLGGEIHLARFHPDIGRVYDRALSPLIPEDLEPGGLYLKAGAKGTAMISWRHLARRRRTSASVTGLPNPPEKTQEWVIRRVARLSPAGRMLWKPLRMELPPRAGLRRNDEGGVALLDEGKETLLLYESLDPVRKRLALYFQRIDGGGKPGPGSRGRVLATGSRDSLHPFLWRPGGKTAALFFRKKRVEKNETIYDPTLVYLARPR